MTPMGADVFSDPAFIREIRGLPSSTLRSPIYANARRISPLGPRDRMACVHAGAAEYELPVIDRAEGCTLYDIDGRAYLDGVSSLWCNLHGHRHPRIDAAIRAQLERVAHVTNLGSSNPTTIELAKRLIDLAPAGLRHVFFSDDGATAVEVALKMAFQYWRQCEKPRPEKRLFVALDGAYHGDTLGSVSVGGVERFHAMFRSLLFEVLRLPAPDRHRLPAGVGADNAAQHYCKWSGKPVERQCRNHRPS